MYIGNGNALPTHNERAVPHKAALISILTGCTLTRTACSSICTPCI
nr:MAG TPA: hypothetical protein [Bacteriophage sp.]